ncbi:MAG: ABC transporter permease, partial [Candidatus Hodarchaeota archaeon]
MSITWRKVWRGLWNNKLRSLLVVLATTTGVFAVGLVIGLYDAMTVQMTESNLASVPPHLTFSTGWFDQAIVDAMQSERGVADTEGELEAGFRWKLEGETDWRDGILVARDDYEEQHMFPIELLEGHWPGRRALAAERMSAEYFNLPIGTPIVVKVGQREHSLPIEGIVRHPHTPPPQLGESGGTFIATMKTAAWLTDQEEGFNTLNVRLESFSWEAAERIGKQIDDRLERLGVRANQATDSHHEGGEN